MTIKVFSRIEKKYLITPEDKKALIKTIKQYLEKDLYFRSKVFNLYFDTDNYDLITQSIDWVDFKEKVRARSYGGYDRVFLEIKTKVKGKEDSLGYKRRIMITRDDFAELVAGQTTLTKLAARSVEQSTDFQIAREVEYLITHFNLRPKILVMYNRESYKGADGLRITFDEKLSYRDHNLKFAKHKNDKMYFKDDHNIIMEIKTPEALPLWLVKKLSELKLYPRRFSKIGNIYQSLRKEQNV